ncbi:hypothetical protein, partial [Salmonella sp. SKLX088796]|uniref:hypothetical protein n=1 Tax=Salmonella sp. SKLX088796 TaxID=3160007 RepID=UPI00375481AE
NFCSCQTARCFNKSKGVLITDLKLKAFRNPQPSWGFSIDKKKGRNAAFLVIRVIFQADKYAVIPLIYFRDGSVSAAIHPDGCYAWI